jgi:transposase
MRADGKSIKQIRTDLGVSFATVYRVLRRAGRVQKRRQ